MLASLKERVEFRICLWKLRGWGLCVLLYKAFRPFDCAPPRTQSKGTYLLAPAACDQFDSHFLKSIGQGKPTSMAPASLVGSWEGSLFPLQDSVAVRALSWAVVPGFPTLAMALGQVMPLFSEFQLAPLAQV